MNQQPIAQTEPDAKRADELAAGDHVIEEYDGARKPAKVLVAVRYRNGNGSPLVSLMLDTLDGQRPLTVDYREDRLVELATDERLAEMEAGQRRAAMVKALHQLADDIAKHRLPLPQYAIRIGGVLESRADLEAWAKHLGVDVVMGGTGKNIPTFDKEVPVSGGMHLLLALQSPMEPKPEPEHVGDLRHVSVLGRCVSCGSECPNGRCPNEPDEVVREWLFTFSAGQTFAGRFVRIGGTYASARSRMNRVFGHAWCAQHTWRSFDEEALQAHLTELPADKWPAHADAAPDTRAMPNGTELPGEHWNARLIREAAERDQQAGE